MTSTRFWELDFLRGFAVALMVGYHFFFDLDYFGILKFPSWESKAIPALFIGTLFLLIVGISLSISFARSKEQSWRGNALKQFKRGGFLLGVAFLISLATFIYPGNGFIVFGIIHLIAFSVLVSPLFKDFKWLNLALGVAIIAAGVAAKGAVVETPLLVWLGFVFPGFYTLDYYPVLPWLGVVLIGMFLGKMIYPQGRRAFAFENKMPRVALLEFLGRHSLAIYLVHQLVLVGGILAFLALARLYILG